MKKSFVFEIYLVIALGLMAWLVSMLPPIGSKKAQSAEIPVVAIGKTPEGCTVCTESQIEISVVTISAITH